MRVHNWRSRLARAVSACARTPHTWGGNDCVVGLGSRWVAAVIGEDPFAHLRGRYSDLEGAWRVLGEEGCADLGDLIASMFEEVHPSEARYGDLAIVASGNPKFSLALGGVGVERIHALAEAGGTTLARRRAQRAFLVG